MRHTNPPARSPRVATASGKSRAGARLERDYAEFFRYRPPLPGVDPYRLPSAFDDSVPVTTSNSSSRWPGHA